MTIASEDITTVRRANLLLLHARYVADHAVAGVNLKAPKKAFAEFLQISPATYSQLFSFKVMGDQMARQIEALNGKPSGWLDVRHEEPAISPAEQSFIDLCRLAWSRQNAIGKRALRHILVGYTKDV